MVNNLVAVLMLEAKPRYKTALVTSVCLANDPVDFLTCNLNCSELCFLTRPLTVNNRACNPVVENKLDGKHWLILHTFGPNGLKL